MSDKHKTRRVRVGDQEADIDVKIVPLIRETWKAGIETFQSCQEGEPGRVWIGFDDTTMLARFLAIVGGHETTNSDLNDRVQQWYAERHQPLLEAENRWVYRVVVLDASLYDIAGEKAYSGPPDFCVHVNLYFPHKDLKTVVAKLKAHNKPKPVKPTTYVGSTPADVDSLLDDPDAWPDEWHEI